MPRGPYALALAVATLCVLAAVTYRIYDPDLWQHLVVGRVIWSTHHVPRTELWSWPTYGAPDVPPSWLFRALLWPFWAAGGVTGVFAWRWLTTLAAFTLLWATARRAGATGVAPLLALVWAALIWRQRTQARPETLAAILLAAELWVLESRRRPGRGGRDPAWAVVPIVVVWVNAHISYFLAFVIGGGYLFDDLLHRRARGAPRRPGALALALAAAGVAGLVNPSGWRALAQPFVYLLVESHQPIFHSIGELSPVNWSFNLRNGLPAFLALFALLAVRRARRRGVDAAELTIAGVFLPQALASQRFLGYFAVAAAPFLARDLADAVAALRWPAALHPPLRRAALAALACAALTAPELARPGMSLGFGLVPNQYPERACDWVAAHGVRGRAFNTFAEGGYLLWRFYPDRGRLPFMDIHQAGTPDIRYHYVYALQDSNAWRDLDRRWRFDWVMLPRDLPASPNLLDFLDADSAHWALVFADDPAALYLRRDGACAAEAARAGYRLLPAGGAALGALGERCARDAAARAALASDLARAVAGSPWNARALSLVANLALQDGRYAAAVDDLQAARRRLPDLNTAWLRIGIARLHSGDPRGALAAFARERRANPGGREVGPLLVEARDSLAAQARRGR